MICLSQPAESPRERLGGFYHPSCCKRSQDGIPDLSQPSSTPQPALEKLQLNQTAKLEIFSRDTLTPKLSSVRWGMERGNCECRESCPSLRGSHSTLGMPRHAQAAVRGRSRAKPWPVIHRARKSCLS